MDVLETISTYTAADGDGVVEIEDVTDMLVRYELSSSSWETFNSFYALHFYDKSIITYEVDEVATYFIFILVA